MDADGRFVFVGGFARAGRGGALALHAAAPGYAMTSVEADVPGTVEIALDRGWAVPGRVVDEQGVPVHYALVRAHLAWSPPWRSGLVVDEVVVRKTWTDAAGSFHLEGLPYGWLRVEAVVPPFGPAGEEGVLPGMSGDPLEIVVRAVPSVDVVIRSEDGGDMVRGRLRHGLRAETLWACGWEDPASWTPGAGPYRLPRGDLDSPVQLEVPGYETWRLEEGSWRGGDVVEAVLRRPAGSSRLTLLLRRAPLSVEVYVRVLDTVPGRRRHQACVRRVAGAHETELDLGAVPCSARGEVWLQVFGRGIGTAHHLVGLVPGGSASETIALEPAAVLEVLCPDAPATGAQLSLRDPNGGSEAWAVQEVPPGTSPDLALGEEATPDGLHLARLFLAETGADGVARARIEGPKPGAWEVVARLAGEAAPRAGTVDLEAGRTSRLVLPPPP